MRPSADLQVGRPHLLMVEGVSKKRESEWMGRTDCNRRVVIPRKPVAASLGTSSEVDLRPGDYVAVRISEAISANTLRAEPLARSSILEFAGSHHTPH